MARYITIGELLRLHGVMIKRYGGSEGVRDLGLIEAAVARPQAGFGDYEAYPDLFMKAAVLLHSLINNHGFIDGNKRTGVTACGAFLSLNGYQLMAEQNELVDFGVRVSLKKLSEHDIAEWLKNHCRPLTPIT